MLFFIRYRFGDVLEPSVKIFVPDYCARMPRLMFKAVAPVARVKLVFIGMELAGCCNTDGEDGLIKQAIEFPTRARVSYRGPLL